MLRLDWCSHETAVYACRRWYSRPEMPRGKLAKIGVREDGQFKGVIIFGCGTGGVQMLGAKLGAGKFGTAEMCRIALRGHETPLSRIIAIACRMLHKAQPGLRLLLTYSDPSLGHHGGIYQAAGWTYIGRSSADFAYRDKAGVLHHSRNASASGLKRFYGKTHAVVRTGNCEKVPLEPKHRYALGLDDEMRAKLREIAQQYPKRPKQTGDAAADLAEEGGSTPTRTLQIC